MRNVGTICNANGPDQPGRLCDDVRRSGKDQSLLKHFVWIALVASFTLAAAVSAQEVGEESSVDAAAKSDKTGTNPINFTYDARFYMETSWFDGGSLVAPTFEFRVPLGRDLANLTNQKEGIFNDLGQKFALRLKFRPQQNLNLDDPLRLEPLATGAWIPYEHGRSHPRRPTHHPG